MLIRHFNCPLVWSFFFPNAVETIFHEIGLNVVDETKSLSKFLQGDIQLISPYVLLIKNLHYI